MTAISFSGIDYSDSLCKRFASLASSYFDCPDEARAPGAKVPLENLFRMLQMLRYDAFSDERRSGILALQQPIEPVTLSIEGDSWHKNIQLALGKALNTAFVGTPTSQAIEQVQSALRWLATDAEVPSELVLNRSKKFMESLISDLG